MNRFSLLSFFLLLRRARFIWFTSPLWTVFGTRECLLIPIKNKIKRNEGFILAMPLQRERKRRIQFWFPHSFSDSVLSIRFLKIQAPSAVCMHREHTRNNIPNEKRNAWKWISTTSSFLSLSLFEIHFDYRFYIKNTFQSLYYSHEWLWKRGYSLILSSTVVINLSIYQYMHWLISRKPNRNVDDFILHTECDKQIENACLIYILKLLSCYYFVINLC